VPFAFRRLSPNENKRYGAKGSAAEGDSTQERIINDLAEAITVPAGIVKKDLVFHLHRYARKHRTDYFVHPQLGEFLRGELDYSLKNEFLDVDGLTSAATLVDRVAKMRVLRRICGHIIDLLD